MSDRVCWIRTVPSAHGTYRPALDLDGTAYDLGGGKALLHARAVITAAERATHDAAVYKQFGDDTTHAGHLVVALRKDRLPIDWPTPLTLEPGVSAFTGEPFLHVAVNGIVSGQWTPADARGHAAHALEADEAAELDGAFYRCLVACDIDDHKARAIVADLANHRADQT